VTKIDLIEKGDLIGKMKTLVSPGRTSIDTTGKLTLFSPIFPEVM
jgi:hypothetical protein